MYLELAEGENNGNYEALAQNSDVLNNYVFVPSGFLGNNQAMYVRSDFFAKNFDRQTGNYLLNKLANMQTVGMSKISGEMVSAGIDKAKGYLDKAQPLFDKIGGFLDKAGINPFGLSPEEKAQQEKKLKEFGEENKRRLAKLKELKAAGVPREQWAAALQPGATVAATPAPTTREFPAVSLDIGQPQPSFWERNKTPILIGVGLVAVAGTLYLVTRKKRK